MGKHALHSVTCLSLHASLHRILPVLVKSLLHPESLLLPAAGCGHSSDSIASHFSRQTHAAVIGGHESDPGSFPWIAALLDPFGFNFCAGALIRKNFILTAAHCKYITPPTIWTSILYHISDVFNVLPFLALFSRSSRQVSSTRSPAMSPSSWDTLIWTSRTSTTASM